VQPDAKKLIAYTSVAHMGFVVLGIFALTIRAAGRDDRDAVARPVDGRAVPPARHAVRAAAHAQIADFGGLAASRRGFAAVFVFTALASIGLPGTSGFVGEFLALIGTFQTHPWVAVIAATGVIFAAYYMLPMVQRIFFNRLQSRPPLLVGAPPGDRALRLGHGGPDRRSVSQAARGERGGGPRGDPTLSGRAADLGWLALVGVLAAALANGWLYGVRGGGQHLDGRRRRLPAVRQLGAADRRRALDPDLVRVRLPAASPGRRVLRPRVARHGRHDVHGRRARPHRRSSWDSR
jgi:hypothetical protein